MNAQSPHILVVEDEEHLAVGIRFNLEAEGYRVTTAADGPSALRAIDREPIDLVILDIMLPGMSGYAVCERLRLDGNRVPVLILSARSLPEDRTRGFDVGANQYLNKPFDLDELLSRVRNLLAFGRTIPPRTADAIFEFGHARVNFTTHETWLHGQPEKLTKLELDLLRYFVEHPDRVISRDELLENVWDLPGDMNTRSVDQFLRRLRKLFEPDPSQPRYFLTVRDAGYRFVPRGE